MVEEAQVPYFDSLQSDPSFEEVRKVLCTENRRPHIPERWKTDDVSSLRLCGRVGEGLDWIVLGGVWGRWGLGVSGWIT